LNRLKILASHPVQYHVPFFRELVNDGMDIEVGYYHEGTAARVRRDPDFGIDIQWDIDLLSGYSYRIFLKGIANYHWPEQFQIAVKLLPWAMQDRKVPLLLVGWFAELVWLIWLLRILGQGPIIVMSETTPLSFSMTPKPGWRVFLLRQLLQNSTANLFIGSRNHEFLRDMDVMEAKLFHMPYSVDNSRFAAEVIRLLPNRIQLCQQFGLDPDKPVFLFCGKLISKKRPLQLLEAYLQAGLAQQAQLLYIGEGELRPDLEKRIQHQNLEHVHLLGFLNQSQMPMAYVLGELLCLISDTSETWGLVVNEAMASGRPVIVSETVGCAADLVTEETGWRVPQDDLPALVRQMRFAYDHRHFWRRMGDSARQKIAGHTFVCMADGLKSAVASI